MLEDVRADHGVKARVGQREPRQVELEVDARLIEISRDIPEVLDPFQTPAQRPLGGEVQNRACSPQQRRTALEEKPLRAVTFVRTAAPAQRVGSIAVRRELRELMPTQRAADPVPAVAHHLDPAIDCAGDP